MARVNVAGVFAHLGFTVDTSGARRFEAEIEKARAAALKPIEQKVDVEYEKARVSLARLEAEATRTKDKIERDKITVAVETDVDRLKQNLAQAATVVEGYQKRIEATDNARSKGQLARYHREGLAAAEAARVELKARQDVLAIIKGANKQQEDDDKKAATAQKQRASATRALLDDRLRAQKSFSASLSAAENERVADEKAGLAAVDAAWNEHLGTLKDYGDRLKQTSAIEKRRRDDAKAAEKEVDRAWQEHLDTLKKVGAEQARLATAARRDADAVVAAEKEIDRQWQQHLRTLSIFGRAQQKAAEDEVKNQQRVIRARDKADAQLRGGERAMRRLMRSAADLSDRNELSVGNLARSFRTLDRASGRSLNLLESAGNRVSNVFRGLGVRLGPLSGSLQKLGLIIVGLVPLFVSLVSVIVELVGSLGAAIAGVGALAVGFAGLLAPLAVIGGAIALRVGKMAAAWTALQNAEQKAGRDSVKSGKQQANTADAVRNAQRGLDDAVRQRGRTERSAAEQIAQAHQTIIDSQKDEEKAQDELTDARARAKREIEDLNKALEDSVFASRRAALSLDEALVELHRVQLDPAATSTQRREAQLAVDEARAAVDDAHTQHTRAVEDVKKGTTTVKDAEDRLATARQRTADARVAQAKAERDAAEQAADANRSVARAAEAITVAQRHSKDAIDGVSATAQTAKEKLAQLGEGERQTLFAFKRISDDFQKTLRPATDAIFLGFAGGLRRVEPLITVFESQFRTFGETIGSIFRHAGESLAGPEWRHAFDALLTSAQQIVRPLSHAIGEVFEIVRNIAVAAQPFVLRFVVGMDRTFGRIASRTSDLGKTRDVIGDLLKHTQAWFDLLVQVGLLLYNVFQAGASGGKDMVTGLTNILKAWNKFLETPEGQKRMMQTFRDARTLLGDIWQFVRGLFEGVTTVLVPLSKLVGWIITFVSQVTKILPGGQKGNPWREMAYWLGIMAALKVTRLTNLFGLMRLALGNAGNLKTLVTALMGGGGGRQALRSLVTEPGATPAHPIYTFEVNPAAATGPGGIPGGGGRGGRGVGGARGVIGAGARILGAIAAVDFAINLVDQHGNPISATVNAAHDLTFGLVPNIKQDEKKGEVVRQQASRAAGGATEDIFVSSKGFKITEEEALVTAGARVIRAGTTDAVLFRKEDRDKAIAEAKKLGADIAKSFVTGLDAEHEFFTEGTLFRRFSEQLARMKPEARASAEGVMIEYARGLERQGRAPRGTTLKLIKDIKAQFGTLPEGIREPTKRGMDALAAQFRRKDIIDSARGMVAELKHTYDDFPASVQFSAATAARDFLTEIEFLRTKAATSTGRLKSQSESDLKAVQTAAEKYGKGANSALILQLMDMGVKGSKQAGHVRHVVATAFQDMATGVGNFSNDAADALYTAIQNMSGNADSVLHALGLPRPKWRLKQIGEYVRQKTSHLTPQRGTLVPGMGDGDRVPAMLEPGEYVLNRRLVERIGAHNLDALNFGEVPRFQRGGSAPAWGSHPALTGAIARLVGVVQSHYPLQVTSTTDHSRLTTSGNVSNHVLGLAADLSASQEVMRRAANWIKNNVGRALLEGIHNPNLSIKDGRTVPPGFWGAATWAQHLTHIHLALRSLVGAGAVAGADRINRVVIQGPQGVMRSVAQSTADRVRTGINRYIRTRDFGGDMETKGAKGALTKAQLRGLWVRAGGPRNVANLMAAIAMAESGGIPSRNNADRRGDGGRNIAAGLWQILGLPFPGNVYDPLTNARMAVSKYRSQGLGAWEAYTSGSYRQYLQRGGGSRPARTARGGVQHLQAGGGVWGSTGHGFGTMFGHGPGVAPARARGNDPYSIGKVNSRAKVKIAAWEAIMGDHGTLSKLTSDYAYYDRLYGRSEEILIDPKTGLVNVDQVAKRVAELNHLETIRVAIVNAMREAARIARRILETYQNLVSRLRRAVSYAPRKERKGIQAQIDLYTGEATSWENNITDIRDQIRLGELDLQDVRDERDAVAQTQPGKAEDAGTDADAEARAAQAEARAAAAAADLATARANLGALLSAGDIGTGAGGGNALSVVRGDIARVLGGPSGPSSAITSPGADGTVPGVHAVATGTLMGAAGTAGAGVVVHVYPQTLIPGTADTMHQVGRAVASALDFNASPAPNTRTVG